MNLTLQKMRWIASSALVFCLLGMVLCHLGEASLNWLAWPRAFFEAATVGALADWFAVVVLFRHPMGIPIPHTAILPNNKGRVAESLATFLEEGFLTEEQLGPRIRKIDFAGFVFPCLGAHADAIASRTSQFAPVLLDNIKPDEITAILAQRARNVILTVNAAPMLAEGLQTLTENGRDREIFSGIAGSFRGLISDNRETIQRKIAEEIPISSEWLTSIPFLKSMAGPALDHFREQIASAVATRTIDKIQDTIDDACTSPDHPLWHSFHARLHGFITDLETSPELAHKIRHMQETLANSALVDDFSRRAWDEVSEFVRRDLAAADSLIRQKISAAIGSAARELMDNAPMRDDTNNYIAAQVLAAALSAKPFIRELVSSTIQAWDAKEMSSKLEANVGSDLQFIRLNGTFVGGLIGLTIHAVFLLIGK